MVSALKEVGGMRSLHNVLEDCYAITKLAARRDWVDVKDVKASFRKYPEQKTFSISMRKWCEDFLALLDLMCDQVCDDKNSFRKDGKRYFGNLCRKRILVLPTLKSRVLTGLVVSRYFGVQYFPVRGMLKIRRRFK